MSIQEQINIDIKEAMRDRNADKLAALRAVKSAIMLEATKKGMTIVPDKVSLALINKLVKQRKDSAAIFIDQNRQDLANDETIQSSYLQEYLPAQMSEDEVLEIVREVIDQLGGSSFASMGKCMDLLLARLNGQADGALISRLVRQELSLNLG